MQIALIKTGAEIIFPSGYIWKKEKRRREYVFRSKLNVDIASVDGNSLKQCFKNVVVCTSSTRWDRSVVYACC